MALVPAICTKCGAQLTVDNTEDACICKFCGTAFIVEKAINLANAEMFNEVGFQKLLNAAHGYEQLDDICKARVTYEQITREYPQKFEGWYGIIVCDMQDNIQRGYFPALTFDTQELTYAKKLATPEQMKDIEGRVQSYNELAKAAIAKQEEEARKRKQEQEREKQRQQQILENNINSLFPSINEFYNFLNKNNYAYYGCRSGCDYYGYCKLSTTFSSVIFEYQEWFSKVYFINDIDSNHKFIFSKVDAATAKGYDKKWKHDGKASKAAMDDSLQVTYVSDDKKTIRIKLNNYSEITLYLGKDHYLYGNHRMTSRETSRGYQEAKKNATNE